MMKTAAHPLAVFGCVLAMAALCAGAAYAACNAEASSPQSSTFMGHTVTEGYGANDSGVHMGSIHYGIDVRTKDGTPVTPLFGGTATVINSSTLGHGVIVTNGSSRVVYAEGGQMAVTNGQQVSTSTVLGDWTSGSGYGTGAHMHLEVQVQDSSGNWTKVDPIEAQKLIASGMDPTSAAFGQAAIAATQARCATGNAPSSYPSGSTGAASGYQQICDQNIRAQVSAQIDATTTKVNDFITTKLAPPPTLSQISNNPCASKELSRISNQFAYAPSRYSQQLTGGLLAAGGPISGIMQNMFKSEFDSINSAAASIPSMLNFQSMASNVMGSLMSSLGLGDAFSSQLCGLMVDMLLKYIQCEAPINLPNLGNIFGSLNNLIPNNCAGQALKSTLYDASNLSALKTLSQPVSSSTTTGASPVSMPTGLQLAK